VVLAGVGGGATSVFAGGTGKGGTQAEGSGLHAWGQDDVGQLGDGGPVESESRTPVAVKGVSCAVSAAVSGLNSFAVLKNGTVEAWGADEDNNSGELGDKGGHFPDSTEPVTVSGITNAAAIAADVADAYVLLNNGTLVAWGDNRFGQFGDGPHPPTEGTTEPVAIAPSVSKVKAIATSPDGAVLALLEDGEVDSWGDAAGNDTLGRTGEGLTPDPVEIESGKPMKGATAVGEGAIFSAALVGGEVKTWGGVGGLSNAVLGAGPSATPGEVPVTVGGAKPLEGVSAIAIGADFGLALVDGEVKAWGQGALGQLGDGKKEESDLPVAVAKLTNIVAVAATEDTAFALDSQGRVWAWGNNTQGEVGTGSVENTVGEPVEVADLGTGNVGLAGGMDSEHEVALGANSGSCESGPGSTEASKTETTPTNANGGGDGGTPSTAPTTATTTPSPAAATEAATKLALQCSGRKLALTDVVEKNERVLLDGAAVGSLAGKTVKILFDGHQQVATAKIGAQGQFSASAPLPPANLRNSNSARYMAESGGLQSLNLKLTRRLILDPPTSSAGNVTLTGEVIPPLGKPVPPIDVEQQLNCTKTSTIARAKPSASGRFDIEVPAPAGALAALYRLSTKVRETTSSSKLFPTDSLPETVGLP